MIVEAIQSEQTQRSLDVIMGKSFEVLFNRSVPLVVEFLPITLEGLMGIKQ